MSAHRRNILIGVAGLLLVIGLAALLVLRNSPETLSRKTVELLEAGKYREAAAEAEKGMSLADSYTFSLICTAFEKYDEGDVKEARSYLDQWQELRKKESKAVYPEEALALIIGLRDKVEKEYLALVAKESEERAKAAQTRRAEPDNRVIAGLPYVGMSESYILNTSLGAPSRSEFKESKFGSGTLGYYYWDQNNKVMFVARTEEDKVYSVTDMRTVRGGSRDKQTPAARQEADPYDVYDYSNPEDFYDEHYDDFFDYYEAEEYWEDHQ